MAFPNLADGEEVHLHTRSHWKVLIPPYLLGLLLVAVIIAGMVFAGRMEDSLGSAARYVNLFLWLSLGIVLIYKFAWPYVVWRCTHYVVTTRQVMWQAGVIRKDSTSIHIGNIRSVDQSVDFNDRLFGCGTLDILSSSGESDSGRIRFTDIPDVDKTYRAMRSLTTAT